MYFSGLFQNFCRWCALGKKWKRKNVFLRLESLQVYFLTFLTIIINFAAYFKWGKRRLTRNGLILIFFVFINFLSINHSIVGWYFCNKLTHSTSIEVEKNSWRRIFHRAWIFLIFLCWYGIHEKFVNFYIYHLLVTRNTSKKKMLWIFSDPI